MSHRDLPVCVGRRHESRHGIMEAADEAARPGKLAGGLQQPEPLSPGDGAGDEPEHLAALVVDAKRFWRTVKSGCPDVGQQSMDGGCPRPGWPPDRVAHAYHAAADVAACERLLIRHGNEPGMLSRARIAPRRSRADDALCWKLKMR